MTTVGILGAGQLGRMLALAGYPLGLHFQFFDPVAESPVDQLAPRFASAYDDQDALRRFADGVDVITYEFENVPVETARFLERYRPIYPPPEALEIAQDRLAEKLFFQRLQIPTPPFAAVSAQADLEAAVAQIGLPAVLKTRRMGYDGKGQYVLRSTDDIAPAWQALGGAPSILEGFVNFTAETSILAIRSTSGETAYYPMPQNTHREGILRLSLVPAPAITSHLQQQAEEYAARVLAELHYAGVLAIEFFVTGDGLLANEMAPRVHNSGHWTIEGAETSQFENHLRATLGLPLGSTALCGEGAAMINLIGTLPDTAAVLAIPNAHLHLYDKAPRPGRKLGHINLHANHREDLDRSLELVRALVPAGG